MLNFHSAQTSAFALLGLDLLLGGGGGNRLLTLLWDGFKVDAHTSQSSDGDNRVHGYFPSVGKSSFGSCGAGG